VETKVGIADRLLNRLDDGSVPDLDRDQPRLGYANGGDLIHRHMRTVGFDLNGVDKMRRRPACTQTAEFLFQGSERALHTALDVGEIESSRFHALPPACRHHHGVTMVALPSPLTAAAIAPGARIENTMIGSFASRASAKAAASITLRSRESASSCV